MRGEVAALMWACRAIGSTSVCVVASAILLTAVAAQYWATTARCFLMLPHGLGGDPQVVLLAACLKVVVLCVFYAMAGYALGRLMRLALAALHA